MLRLLIVLLLLNSGPLGAQCDTAFIRVNEDSILKRHLSLATQQTVTRYQRRALARLDSILTLACNRVRPPANADTFGVTTLALWPTGRQGVFPATGETALVCAAVQRGGKVYLGRSTVTVRFMGSNNDPVIDDTVTPDSVTLVALCRLSWAATSERVRQGIPWTPIAAAPLIAVTWTVHRIDVNGTGERVPLPVPAPVP